MQSIAELLAINAATATTTSGKIWVGDYDKVGILIRGATMTSASAVFTFKGGFAEKAGDNPTMTALNTLIDNVTNTNGQTLTRVASKTLTTAVDNFLWLSPETPVTHLEATATLGSADVGTVTVKFFGFRNDAA